MQKEVQIKRIVKYLRLGLIMARMQQIGNEPARPLGAFMNSPKKCQSISRASEELFVTVLAIGKKRVLGSLLMDAEEITPTVTSFGREVVI